jgi:hypothetical protein
MEQEQFIQVLALLDPNYNDDEDSILYRQKKEFIKRIVAIPLAHIYYIQEGIDKGTTDITLEDGDVITAIASYQVIFSIWNEWYINQSNTFISYVTRNN